MGGENGFSYLVLCPLNTVKRGNDDLIDAPLTETNYFLGAGSSAAFLSSAAFSLLLLFLQLPFSFAAFSSAAFFFCCCFSSAAFFFAAFFSSAVIFTGAALSSVVFFSATALSAASELLPLASPHRLQKKQLKCQARKELLS